MIYAGTEGKTLDDLIREFKMAEKFTPSDFSLEPWFRTYSWGFIKMRATYEGKLITLLLGSDKE